jgi:hypothetical protein
MTLLVVFVPIDQEPPGGKDRRFFACEFAGIASHFSLAIACEAGAMAG